MNKYQMIQLRMLTDAQLPNILDTLEIYVKLQWNLYKPDTIGGKKVSALQRFFLRQFDSKAIRSCHTVRLMEVSALQRFHCIRFRSSRSEMFLGKGVLKICSRFTGEDPRRSVILMKLQTNFIEITLQHGCSPVNFLRTPLDGSFCRFRILTFMTSKNRLLLKLLLILDIQTWLLSRVSIGVNKTNELKCKLGSKIFK